jgi:hypothetical protein
LGLRR